MCNEQPKPGKDKGAPIHSQKVRNLQEQEEIAFIIASLLVILD